MRHCIVSCLLLKNWTYFQFFWYYSICKIQCWIDFYQDSNVKRKYCSCFSNKSMSGLVSFRKSCYSKIFFHYWCYRSNFKNLKASLLIFSCSWICFLIKFYFPQIALYYWSFWTFRWKLFFESNLDFEILMFVWCRCERIIFTDSFFHHHLLWFYSW